MEAIKPLNTRSTRNRSRAFTLVELLVMVAIIAILVSLELPALTKAKTTSAATTCLSNLKQLQIGAMMYSADFNDYMMPNAPYESAVNKSWCGGFGESWGNDSSNSVYGIANTNYVYYTLSLMAPYVANQISLYRCPADNIPSADGFRLRSYSMNGEVGDIYIVGKPQATYDVGGTIYVKNSDLTCPGAANTVCFADESTWSQLGAYADGWIQIATTDLHFSDAPAAWHNGACGLSFEEGHSEIHKWQTTILTSLPYAYNQTRSAGNFAVADVPIGNLDWIYWAQHTSCTNTGH